MGQKKRLRRELADLTDQLQRERSAHARVTAEQRGAYDRLQDALLEAGYLRVTGDARTPGDRLRAARAGVLVLGDVHVLQDSEISAERGEEIDERYGASLRTVPARTRYTVALHFTGDPDVLNAFADSMAGRRP